MGMAKTNSGTIQMDRDNPSDAPHPKPRRARLRQDFSSNRDLHLDPITRNLRRAFDEIAAEPLPEEMIDLLRKIDEAAGEGGQDGR